MTIDNNLDKFEVAYDNSDYVRKTAFIHAINMDEAEKKATNIFGEYAGITNLSLLERMKKEKEVRE